jgi:uncharacterized protein YecT (DUF1311 family)
VIEISIRLATPFGTLDRHHKDGPMLVFAPKSTYSRLLLAGVLAMGCIGSAAAYSDVVSDLAQSQAEVKIRPTYQQCIDATGGVTPDIKACMSTEYAFQDKRLNMAYKRLMASLKDAAKASLRAEERQWIKEKEARCDAGSEPGQADELAAYDCSVTRTATRATELEARLSK